MSRQDFNPQQPLSQENQAKLLRAFIEKVISDDEFLKLLKMKGGVPEQILKGGSAAIKGIIGITDAYNYAQRLIEEDGYPDNETTVLCAVAGAIYKGLQEKGGILTMRGGGQLLIGAAETVEVVPLAILLGLGGVGGVILGGVEYLKADTIGYQVAENLCRVLNQPVCKIKVPPLISTILLPQPNGIFKKIDFSSQTVADKKLFEEKVKTNPYLNPAEKDALIADYNLQWKEAPVLAKLLGIDFSEMPPQGVALFSHPNKMSMTNPSGVLITKETKQNEKKGEVVLDYDWQAYGVDLSPNDPRRKSLLEYMADKDGLLTKEGKSKVRSPSKKVDEASPSYHSCQLSSSERTILKDIKESVTVTLDDGKTVSIGEFVTNYLKEQSKIAAAQKRVDNLKAAASTMITVGTFFDNKKLVTLGSALGHTINLAVAIPRALAFDPVAIATCIESIFGIAGLFRDKDFIDPNQIIFQQLQQISQQVEQLRELVIDEFNKIHHSLRDILLELTQGFQTVYVEIYVSRLITDKKLTQIQQSIHQLSLQLNKQIYGLWLNPLIDARASISHYQRRYGNLSSLPIGKFAELEQAADCLSTWCSEKSADDNSTGAHLYYPDCPADKVLAVLSGARLPHIIGFLVLYSRDKLNITLNTGFIANTDIWLLAANAYDELISEASAEFYQLYDSKHHQYKRLITSGNELLKFYRQVQTHTELFDALFEHYKTDLLLVAVQLNMLLQTFDKGKGLRKFDNSLQGERQKVGCI